MSSHDPILPQQKLMANWDGRPVDARGILRIMNEKGSRPPLLWIFNEAQEPALLARCLGEDQPLIFSRSSHLIVPPGEPPSEIRNLLSLYLARELGQHFPHAQFDIGTSCQGSSIAMTVGNLLQSAGIGVGHFCVINCALPSITTDRPALLVYGDQDPKSNPFVRDPMAARLRANSAFSNYERFMVQAAHGQFYADGTIDAVMARFHAFRSGRDYAGAANCSTMDAASSSTVG